MSKLLLALAPPQERWLRAEAERLGLSVSELLRRALDEYRERRPSVSPDTYLHDHTAMLNVLAANIAAKLQDELAYAPPAERATARALAEQTWELIEVPSEDYPRHWTRWENVTLEGADVEYVASRAERLLSEALS